MELKFSLLMTPKTLAWSSSFALKAKSSKYISLLLVSLKSCSSTKLGIMFVLKLKQIQFLFKKACFRELKKSCLVVFSSMLITENLCGHSLMIASPLSEIKRPERYRSYVGSLM